MVPPSWLGFWCVGDAGTACRCARGAHGSCIATPVTAWRPTTGETITHTSEAEQAARHYRLVEPEHRTGARPLAKDWEEQLTAQRQLQEDYERFVQAHPRPLSAPAREAVQPLAQNIPALWHAPTTTMADRQEIIRQVIHRVMVAGARSERSAAVEQQSSSCCSAWGCLSPARGGELPWPHTSGGCRTWRTRQAFPKRRCMPGANGAGSRPAGTRRPSAGWCGPRGPS